jgi:hypothetical protein
MAWQSEQTWFTYSSNIWLNGNINPSSITHTGTSLRVKGTIAAGARGSSGYGFYYLDYTSYAQPEGGSKIALGSKGRWWRVGESDTTVSFDVTISNVPAAATSRSFYVNFYGPNTNSVKATLRWTLNFSASGSAPSGLSITNVSNTWNSVTFMSGVSNWGGLSGKNHSIIFTGSTNGSVDNFTSWSFSKGRYEFYHDNTQDTSWTFTGKQSNASSVNDSPIALKGMTHYKLGIWANNAAGEAYVLESGAPLYYTPPAPATMTYTDPGGEGTKVFPFVFTGDTANNHTTYDTSSLTRTIRYKVEGANDWTYVENATEALIDAQTTFNVSVPGSKSATVEGWMTYHGVQSEVKTVTVYNGNPPSRVYGSVNGQSKLCAKVYGSVGGTSVEIVKLYASVNGKSKSILG